MGEGGVLYWSDGWWYSPATTVLPVTWQATLRPYRASDHPLGEGKRKKENGQPKGGMGGLGEG